MQKVDNLKFSADPPSQLERVECVNASIIKYTTRASYLISRVTCEAYNYYKNKGHMQATFN